MSILAQAIALVTSIIVIVTKIIEFWSARQKSAAAAPVPTEATTSSAARIEKQRESRRAAVWFFFNVVSFAVTMGALGWMTFVRPFAPVARGDVGYAALLVASTLIAYQNVQRR
jgi:hypothetical protein